MRKVWIFAFCWFLGLLFWCGKSFDPQEFQRYNNSLIAFQEEAVSGLKQYYQNIETIANGDELFELYSGTFSDFWRLYQLVIASESWKGDGDLKVALSSYITWLQLAFELYEKPIVERMGVFSGEKNEYYLESKSLVQESSLLFAAELARLDKVLDAEYWSFIQKYNSELSSR